MSRPTHLVATDPADFPAGATRPSQTSPAGRCSCARPRCSPSSASSAATSPGRPGRSTRRRGTMHGTPLPAGLLESDRLPQPVFTPSTKAESVGPRREHHLRRGGAISSAPKRPERPGRSASPPTNEGRRRALERGIVIADTKFELGFIDGELAICDEILTPDSSRFWPADAWEPGTHHRRSTSSPSATGPSDGLGQVLRSTAATPRGRRCHT